MRPGCITKTYSLSGSVSSERGKLNHRRKKSSSRSWWTKVMLIVFFGHWVPFISTLCHQRRPSIRNITSLSWRSSGSMLIENAQDWRTGGSCTRIIHILILHNWFKNTSETQMLNCHLIHCTRLVWYLGTLKKHLRGGRFASNKMTWSAKFTHFLTVSSGGIWEDYLGKMDWKNGTLQCEWGLVFWESTNRGNWLWIGRQRWIIFFSYF